jgi:hypothetical protein
MGVFLIIWLVSGVVCLLIANAKGRNPALAFVLGVLGGLIAILVYAVLPSVQPNAAALPAPRDTALESMDALERLNDLRASGALTDDEFAVKKQALLERI